MNLNRNKIVIFLVIIVILRILTFSLTNYLLPVKTSMLSGDVGRYKNNDILFYTASESYTFNDFILYTPSSKPSTIVAEIVEINPDGTFKVIGINPEPIEDLDQNNLKKEQIIGKVISSISGYIYYPLSIAMLLILAFIITHFIFKKIKK